jgi:hypothetical protein
MQTAILITGCSETKVLNVYDDFENNNITKYWELDKIIPGDLETENKIVRAGKQSIKITLHSGDKFEEGIQGDKSSERAELTEKEEFYSKEDNTYNFKFSMFIPQDFPIVPTRLVIAQWKQECPGGYKCDNNSPVLAVRYISGKLMITQNTGSNRVMLYETNEEMRNRWLDFKFQLNFSQKSSGKIIVYLNDKIIVDYKGVTAYPENETTGYISPGVFYFKMGLYRNLMSEPMTIYIDEYSKEQITK